MLLSEWMNLWLDTWCSGLRPRTVESYRDCNRLYITPLIGDSCLDDLAPEDIQTMIDLIAADGHGRTAELCLDVLRAALRQAVRTHRLQYNPADACITPKYGRRRVDALEDDALSVWLPEAARQPNWPLIALMLYAGLRRGEAIALRWSDVDLTAGTLRVVRQAVMIAGELQISEPKSDAGRRLIPITPELAGVLRARRAAALRAGHASGDLPVMCSCSGSMIKPSGLYSTFRRLQLRTGVSVHPHQLRHTACTQLLSRGLQIKTVQYVMGHSTAALTLDIYASLQYNTVKADFAICGLAF